MDNYLVIDGTNESGYVEERMLNSYYKDGWELMAVRVVEYTSTYEGGRKESVDLPRFYFKRIK